MGSTAAGPPRGQEGGMPLGNPLEPLRHARRGLTPCTHQLPPQENSTMSGQSLCVQTYELVGSREGGQHHVQHAALALVLCVMLRQPEGAQ